MRFLKITGIIILVIYIIIGLVMWTAQDRVIFHPSPLPDDFQFRMGEEVWIEVEKDIKIHGLWIKGRQPARGAILYLHGNRGSNRRCQGQVQTMTGNGYDILMIDYRGYGKSDGTITSEKQLYQDAQKAYNFLKQHFEESKIVLVGYSLGSGMASWLAANNNPQQLVLLAPYLSFYDLKRRYLPFPWPDFLVKYPLDNQSHLKKVRCPVTLFHGTADEVIPYDSSVQLAKVKPELTRLVKLDGESHRGTIFNSTFRRTFVNLLKY